jgi:hypothetical protein
MDMVYLRAIKTNESVSFDPPQYLSLKMSKMSKYILLITLWITPLLLLAQKNGVISGVVRDAQSGESLIGCNIIETTSGVGVSTNNYGFYSVSVPKNQLLTFSISFVGYKTEVFTFKLNQDSILNIKLSAQAMLNEIEVSVQRNKQIQSAQVSVLSIPIKQLASVPSLIGEKDLLKSMQLLPGVQFGQEGTSGLFVRGGSPDQNLILLDDVPMYNVSHLYGFFSIFNTDAVKSADIYKGGFPAKYGGRLSSVIDIHTKDGNNEKWQGNANLGVLAASGFIEGPLKKDKASIFLSARRSLLDIWTLPFSSVKVDNSNSKGYFGYYFYDITSKINYTKDDKNRFYWSFYTGKDYNRLSSNTTNNSDSVRFNQTSKTYSGWGNLTTSLRWNHLFSNRLFANFTAAYTKYAFQTGSNVDVNTKINGQQRQTKADFSYLSSINDILIKQDFDYFAGNGVSVQFGAVQSLKTFRPGVNLSSISQTSSLDTFLTNPSVFTANFAFYSQNDFDISDKIKINAGLRYDVFVAKKLVNHYLQPRITVRLLINSSTSIKTSFSTINQDLHLLSNSTAGLPTDLWLPATAQIRPEQSAQFVMGFFKNFDKKGWSTSVEAYYKTFKNIIEYKEGASFLSTFSGWEDKVEVGKGTAYGIEFFLHKKEGKINGWMSYTLSWNDRQFEKINNGQVFPFKYDRRHYLNIFISKSLKEGKRSFSTAFVFASGNAVSLPTNKYEAASQLTNNVTTFTNFFDQNFYAFDSQILLYPQRNNFRMRPYSRLDLMYNYIKEKKWGTRTFSIGVYNALFYRNPYFLVIDNNSNPYLRNVNLSKKITINEVSIFNFIPAISWNWQFK